MVFHTDLRSMVLSEGVGLLRWSEEEVEEEDGCRGFWLNSCFMRLLKLKEFGEH